MLLDYYVPFHCTTQGKMPLFKEILEHDIEDGTITCHSLNDNS